MESVNMVSLTDRVISKCHLKELDLVLVTSSLGLCVKWVTTKGKNEKMIKAAVVSKSKIVGKLYPVALTRELELALFGKAMKSATKEASETIAAVIACSTGEVVAVHSEIPGVLASVCHTAESVVWTGCMNVSGTSAILVMGKSGTIHIGISAPSRGQRTSQVNRKSGLKTNMVWCMHTLSAGVVTCSGLNDKLIFSDGQTLWLCNLSFVSGNQLDTKCHRLPFNGVIKIISADDECFELVTLDGRKYVQTWENLIKKSKGNEISVASSSKEEELSQSIEKVMVGIQHCSKVMQKEGKLIHDLDVYLRQVSIAHRLLQESNESLFAISVKVEHNAGQENYIALVELSKQSAGLDFEGQWWSIVITVNYPEGHKHTCLKLDHQSFARNIFVPVPVPTLSMNKDLGNIGLKCHLILNHFSLCQPVCRIFACETELDIFHFFTVQRNVSKTNMHPDFNYCLKNISSNKYILPGKKTVPIRSVPYCEVGTSFVCNDDNASLLKSVLGLFSSSGVSTDLSEDGKISVHVWYLNSPVSLHYSQSDKRIFIKLEGPDPFAVLSAKSALEKRVKRKGSSNSKVILTPEVMRQAQLTHNILEFESSKASTPAALTHLHQATTKLLSQVPL